MARIDHPSYQDRKRKFRIVIEGETIAGKLPPIVAPDDDSTTFTGIKSYFITGHGFPGDRLHVAPVYDLSNARPGVKYV